MALVKKHENRKTAAIVVTVAALVLSLLFGQTSIARAAEENTFNAGWFGAFCQVYGGYENNYFEPAEEPPYELVYWWTRADQGLLSADKTMNFSEFMDLARRTFTAAIDEEAFLQFLIDHEAEYDCSYDPDAQTITLEPVYGGGGDNVNLRTYQSDVTDGTGWIRCVWIETDLETEEETVLEECLITLQDGAVESYVPLKFQSEGSEYAGKAGTFVTLEAPEVYDSEGEEVNTDDYLIKWYRVVWNEDGYELVNIYDGDDYDFGDTYEAVEVTDDQYTYYTCEFWKQDMYSGERTRVADIVSVPYQAEETDCWIKVVNTSYQEDQDAEIISYLNMSYDPLPVGATLGDLQVTGEARYDVTPVGFGQDDETYDPSAAYTMQDDGMTVVLRVVPKDGYRFSDDPAPEGYINGTKLSYYGDASSYTWDPEKEQYPDAHYFAFTGLQSEYLYDVEDGEATITGYQGRGGDLSIPSKLAGIPVTEIGEGAFTHAGLTSVVIPKGVKVIGDGAFASNSDMTKVTIPNTVTDIGRTAFYGCGFTEVTVPGSVKNIEYGAFLSCKNLQSVVLENGVQNIENEAFNVCWNLTSVTFSNTLKKIGGLAFNKCPITSLNIPGSVETIGDMAFCACGELKTLTIGAGVKTIASFAFSSCRSLTKVTLPKTVKSIGDGAFMSCEKLADFVYGGTAAEWKQVKLGQDAVPSNIKVTVTTPAKSANTLSAKGKSVTLKLKNLKKKNQVIKTAKAVSVTKAQGAVTYQLKSVKKAKFKKYFKVAKNGKITVKKGLKKGTYTLTVAVTAAGNASYKAGTKNVTVKVIVK